MNVLMNPASLPPWITLQLQSGEGAKMWSNVPREHLMLTELRENRIYSPTLQFDFQMQLYAGYLNLNFKQFL